MGRGEGMTSWLDKHGIAIVAVCFVLATVLLVAGGILKSLGL